MVHGLCPLGLSLHIALTASLEDILGAYDALRSNDVTPLSFFATERTEPSVIGWMPAAVVYFRDPHGHLIEHLAMLDEPPAPRDFYQRAGFRLLSVERDASLPDSGYPSGATIDGVPLRDRVWLNLQAVEEA